VSWLPAHRLWHRRVLAPELHRTEALLGTARLVLAAASLVAIYIDPTEPSRFRFLCYALLVAYVSVSAGVVALQRINPAAVLRLVPALHVLDIVWPAALTVFTTGPSSPFFALFTFVIVSAAYRWGLRATLATAVTVVALTIVEPVLSMQPDLVIAFELNRLIIRCSYLLLVSLLVGVIAEREHVLNAQAAAIARCLAAAQVQGRLREAFATIACEVLTSLGMNTLLLVLKQAGTGRTFLWRATHGQNSADVLDLDHEEALAYLASIDPRINAWQTTALDDGRTRCLAIDEGGARISGFRCSLIPASGGRLVFASQLCVNVAVGAEWEGRVLVLDAARVPLDESALKFLQTLTRQVAPALYNMYLVRRLRTRVGAVERGRIARELHDGVIQSLISMQFQLETLRREAEQSGSPWIADRIDQLQEQLHGEVMNLRDLMQDLRPPDASSGRIVELIAEQVERFGSHSGIRTRFICDLIDARIPPRVCQEVVRIVQESLVNIRKHSGALNVVVRFEADEGFWRLVVDDDGRGFNFKGRLTHEEMEKLRRGPIVIRERARLIRAELTIDSQPGQGSRLELRVPQVGR
jgi:signal transduction histidine kinase